MTIKIPVVFEKGVFKPLIDVPFKTHQRLTFNVRIKDSEGFTPEEWRKIERLFNERGGKTCSSAKASLDFHRKLCGL